MPTGLRKGGRNRGRAHRYLDEQCDELHVAQRELPVEVRADRADVAAGGRAGLQELRQAGLALGQAALLLQPDAERGLPRPDEESFYDSTFSRTVWRLYGGSKGPVMCYYHLPRPDDLALGGQRLEC